ncbi:hypothetical protein AB0D37_43765 [Streptomyces sp. NPDC048384]|uniref:hypothetical protein n=1 Tax=Streptomyces sp. NPDC048384 TaxID=3155487 RepID=UPI003430D68A
MFLTKRYITAAVAAAFVVGGLSAPAALAAPDAPRTSPPAAAAQFQGAELDNLSWTPVPTMGGGTIWMLRVSSDPNVEPGGLYFLYNPDTSSVSGKFAVGDDIRVRTVRSWQAAVFAPDLDGPHARRTEVRYGDPQNPDAAQVVASVTNGWISQ